MSCGGQRLPKHERLWRRGEIVRVLRSGTRWTGLGIEVICLPNTLGYDRVGVLVSRRNGNAANRNYQKRVMRDVFRRNKTTQAPFMDILIRPLLLSPSWRTTVETCLKKWQESAGRSLGPSRRS